MDTGIENGPARISVKRSDATYETLTFAKQLHVYVGNYMTKHYSAFND
jgi:hypothetical protein